MFPGLISTRVLWDNSIAFYCFSQYESIGRHVFMAFFLVFSLEDHVHFSSANH